MRALTDNKSNSSRREQPHFEATDDKITVFEAAYQQKWPVLLKRPVGCVKKHIL